MNPSGPEFRWPWRKDDAIVREVAEELDYHLERRVTDLMAAGLSREEAEAEARRRLGDLDEAREALTRLDRAGARRQQHADARDRFLLAARQAWRQVRGAPAMSAVAILTLALGVGASTALLSVVHRMYRQPLPYPEATQLVELEKPLLGFAADGFAVARRAREHPAFAHLGLYYPGGGANIGLPGEATWVPIAQVDAGFFRVFDLSMTVGRAFGDEETTSGAARTVILSEGLWRDAFGRRPDIVGHEILVNSVPATVIGVAPAAFEYPTGTRAWLPLPLHFDFFPDAAAPQIVARLGSGVTPAVGTEMIAPLYARPDDSAGDPGALIPLREHLVGPLRRALYTALAATICVLLIGGVNVANLLAARLGARRQEFAVRRALGATRGQLVAQVFGEVGLVGVLAGAAGIAVATAGLGVLLRIIPRSIPLADGASMTSEVVIFAGALTTVLVLLIGGLAAWRVGTTSTQASPAHGAARSTGDREWSAVRTTLVVGEVALAFLLVAAAALLVRSYRELSSLDLGVNPGGAITFHVRLPGSQYAAGQPILEYARRLHAALTALPGVRVAGIANNLPFSGAMGVGMPIMAADGEHSDTMIARLRVATADYFTAIGQPILRGVPSRETDPFTQAQPATVVINQRLATRLWPGTDPIGRQVELPGFAQDQRTVLTVAAVVGDVRHRGPENEPDTELYLPLAVRAWNGSLGVIVRTDGNPARHLAAVRAAVTRLDPQVPPHDLLPLAEAAATTTAPRRFLLQVIGAFAVVALALAVIGLYGVISQVAQARTREFAIRQALGAPPSLVLRSLGGWALRRTAFGLGLGLLGALATARVLAGLLFGVGPLDPVTLLGVSALFLGVTWLSCLRPARFVRRTDPARVLSTEQ